MQQKEKAGIPASASWKRAPFEERGELPHARKRVAEAGCTLQMQESRSSFTHLSRCLQPQPVRAAERALEKRQEDLIYQRKHGAGYKKGEKRGGGGWGSKEKN